MVEIAKSKTIAIAGAGIAGLTAAYALSKHGFNIDIYEKTQEFSVLGAGIQLSPNATNILAELGLLDDVLEAANQPDELRLTDGISARPITSILLGEDMKQKYGAPYLAIHRMNIHKPLLAACLSQDNITLHRGTSVQSATPIEGGVSFNAKNEATGEITIIKRDALISADGVWSKLREHYFGTKPKFTGEIAWRNQIPAEKIPKEQRHNNPTIWLGPSSHLVQYPIANGTLFNIVATEQINEAELAKNRWEGLKTYPANHLNGVFKNWSKPIRDFVSIGTKTQEWIAWPLYEIDPSSPWSKERFVIIGDAAHAMLPFMAQGGCAAIEDAMVLADCFAEQPEALDEAITNYVQKRRKRIERLARGVKFNQWVYHMHAPLSWARNFAMRLIPKSLLMARFNWLYSWKHK